MLRPFVPKNNTRLGIQYFTDTLHYRVQDLQAWLPELQAMGMSWVKLLASPARAIPEDFLTGLIANDIEPVIHIPISMTHVPALSDLAPMLEAYARWGVHYVCLFDRPNAQGSWGAGSWAQGNLVERFLDNYLPFADASARVGLYPVFPPLEPGGHYWDTAFLRTALQAIIRRGYTRLLDRMVVGAYAWADERPIEWGAGGPERWPGALPYTNVKGEEDQRGFRIFDWYLAITKAVLGEPLPIIIMGGGVKSQNRKDCLAKNMTIANLLLGNLVEGQESVPEEVLGSHFWTLSENPKQSNGENSWYRSDGTMAPIVALLKKMTQERDRSNHLSGKKSVNRERSAGHQNAFPISHYLLLPKYEWGIADWHLDVIKPFVRKYKPTVGFSLEEAAFAAHVTVIGSEHAFPEAELNALRSAGCLVDRIQGDGTEIATILATM